MLLSLHIENIAVIEKSDVDFFGGFNVLTGETGAGKSIIIDSINLLLGNKSSKNLIRTGADFAFVSAVFAGFNAYQKEVFAEYDIAPDDDGNIVVSRRISADGRNTTKINGIAVTVSVLKNISHLLVNIHGQHDGSRILDESSHIHYLDEYCSNSALISEYNKKYDKVKQLRTKIEELTELKNRKDELEDTLKFKINEITAADIKPGEYQKLIEASKIASNSALVTGALNNAEALLSSDETGILENISSLINEFAALSLAMPEFKSVCDTLNKVKLELEDIRDTVTKKSAENDDFEFSPDYIEQRIFNIEKVTKKYGGEQQTLDALAAFNNELSLLEDNDYELSFATEQYKKAIVDLERSALVLSDNRRKKATALSASICEQLNELDMPNVKFEVSIKRNLNTRGGNKYTAYGFDVIEFLISANAGQELKPLSKIASGGELSRIMLCLKTILNGGNAECGTVIYDEIDSGVSGSTAQKIGCKLKKAAKEKQVFSITHLAQIAALADNHYKVEKHIVNGTTVSSVRLLNSDEHKNEVARIMGGVEITDQILKSAEELINNSKMC